MPKFVVKYTLADHSQELVSAPFIDMYDALKWTHDNLRPMTVTKLSIEPVEPRRLTLREIVILLRRCQNDFLYRNVIDTETGTKLSDMINFIEIQTETARQAGLCPGLDQVIIEEGE